MPLGSRSTVLQRRLQIAERIRDSGFERVESLAVHIGVSAVTIRADLAYLEEQGLVFRSSGGAYPVVRDRGIHRENRQRLHGQHGRDLAAAAANFAEAGATILLGPGALTSLLPAYFPVSSRMQLVLTSLEALAVARQFSGGDVHLLGGKVQYGRQECDGPIAVQTLATYQIDLFVMEAAGLEKGELRLNAAFSQPLHQEAARRAARMIVLLAVGDGAETSVKAPGLLERADILLLHEVAEAAHRDAFSRNGFLRVETQSAGIVLYRRADFSRGGRK